MTEIVPVTSRRFNIWSRASNDGQEDNLINQNSSNDDGDRSQQVGPGDVESRGTETPTKYTSQLAALFIIVNVTVGVGLLAMPAAVQSAGIVVSLIIQAIFLLIIMTTCIMCTELTVQTNVDSYHRLVAAHCHPVIDLFNQISIFLLVFGTSVAYIVTVGDQSDRIFASLYGPTFCNTWYMNRRFIMSALTIFVMKPLCSAKTVDFLKYGR